MLETPLRLNQFVQPVCLPSMDTIVPTGTMLMVSGFGTRKSGSEWLARKLQYVEVPTLDLETCNRLYGRTGNSEDMMCAGYLEGGKDACQSDSGGPLVQISEGKTGHDQAVLIGIVTWGTGCGMPNYPGYYVNVTYIVPWIDDTRWDNWG